MRTFFFTLFILPTFILFAQKDSLYQSTEVENIIYSYEFDEAKSKLENFIEQNNVRVERQRDSKTDTRIEFLLNQETYVIYDSLIKSLGYSTSKKVNTTSNYNRIIELKLELKFLKQKRKSYQELINKLDESSENYFSLWNEQKITEEKIFNKERDLINLNQQENIYFVSLNLNDEVTSPENTKVSFVNMPGLEYSYLVIESPKSGISSEYYQGYFLKYLFTKGKSFGTVGVYKNTEISKTDSVAYSDMFVLGFGQDFYSKYLGRGGRRFFNLYSGYTIGGILATGKTSVDNLFFLSPSIGLELYKNKYFLIDSKVNYFIPFKNNRNLRGISYNVSFNFVF